LAAWRFFRRQYSSRPQSPAVIRATTISRMPLRPYTTAIRATQVVSVTGGILAIGVISAICPVSDTHRISGTVTILDGTMAVISGIVSATIAGEMAPPRVIPERVGKPESGAGNRLKTARTDSPKSGRAAMSERQSTNGVVQP